MPQNWKTYKLEELCTRVCVGFVGTCHKYYTEEGIGVPMIRTTNLSPGGLELSDVQYIEEAFHLKQKKSQLKKGDILIARHGTNGQACLFDLEIEANCLNVVIVKPDHSKVDYKWMLYAINSPVFRDQVDAHSTGSVQKVVNTTALAGFNINTPPLPEQKAIAAILSALDDKIELNLQMNKTLEEMAMTQYKHWFVDFEFPSEALAQDGQAQPYKTAGGKFVESELGMIPEGWEVKTIEEITTLKYGKALKKTDRIAGEFPVYGSSGEVGTNKDFLIEGPSLIIGRKGNVGSVYWEERNSFPIDTVYYVNDLIRKELRLLFFKFLFTDFKSTNSDSVVPGLNRNLAHNEKLVYPPESILNDFMASVESYYTMKTNLESENKTLTKTRDTLLPKLISGEVRVKQAEKELKNVL